MTRFRKVTSGMTLEQKVDEIGNEVYNITNDRIDTRELLKDCTTILGESLDSIENKINVIMFISLCALGVSVLGLVL